MLKRLNEPACKIASRPLRATGYLNTVSRSMGAEWYQRMGRASAAWLVKPQQMRRVVRKMVKVYRMTNLVLSESQNRGSTSAVSRLKSKWQGYQLSTPTNRKRNLFV